MQESETVVDTERSAHQSFCVSYLPLDLAVTTHPSLVMSDGSALALHGQVSS